MRKEREKSEGNEREKSERRLREEREKIERRARETSERRTSQRRVLSAKRAREEREKSEGNEREKSERRLREEREKIERRARETSERRARETSERIAVHNPAGGRPPGQRPSQNRKKIVSAGPSSLGLVWDGKRAYIIHENGTQHFLPPPPLIPPGKAHGSWIFESGSMDQPVNGTNQST